MRSLLSRTSARNGLEAEKAAAVNLMHVASGGVFGRLWMAGTESDKGQG